MSISFRKTFRVGPFRVNASKSGVGVAGGVRGLSVGLGTRGGLLAAGKWGIYMRKHLGSTNGNRHDSASSGPLLLLALITVTVGVIVLFWVWVLS